MYTLTRKLAVVSLTLVLSVLVYGCGGSSKQALVKTDVDTDMVTAVLAITPGTYPIQPGGTATAGDATFSCPAEGAPCTVTVTVADNGMTVVTSTGGMATAMDSASATERDAAKMELTTTQADLTTARADLTTAQADLTTAQADLTTARAGLMAAQAELTTTKADLTTTQADLTTARADLTTAQADLTTAQANLMTAQTNLTTTQADLTTARADLTTAQTNLTTAQANLTTTQADLTTAQADLTTARADLTTAQADLTTAQADLTTARADLTTAQADLTTAQADLILANRRANPNDVDLSDLLSNYMTITPGTYPIQPGGTATVDDVTFACPRDGLACEVIVDEDGTVESAGGMATAQNSMAAMTTRTAIALATTALTAVQEPTPSAPVIATDDVARSPAGVITITLSHAGDPTADIEYTSEAVDPGHEIDGMGQTLKRDDSVAAMMDVEAVPAAWMDEATVYTYIDPAKRGKVKYEGIDENDGGTSLRFEVEPDQVYDNAEGDTFTGAYVRMDDTRIPGTFTCDKDEGCAAVSGTETVVGTLVLISNPGDGWEFVSKDNVKEGETPDADYMYFGYWLKSPVDTLDYRFATFSGGNQLFNVADDSSLKDADNPLKATYEGGAAGRYVTRELRLKGGGADPFSPGFHGRFTAKAKLMAYFGLDAQYAGDNDASPVIPSKQNMVEGTITEFMDGDTELGFKVILRLSEIGTGTIGGGLANGNGLAKATFGNTDDNTGTGTWDAQFFGPNADEEALPRVIDRTVPSGVAGQFEVGSSFTRVVGAFAAEKR